ncbi:MAG: hypothetical protein GY778_23095 [bacterium]|nr:hypothetical protein [bacterium]
MHLRPTVTRSLVIMLLWSGPFVSADWQVVAPGIEYQEFDLADPNNVFVTRLDRGNPSCTIDSTIAAGRLIAGRETVSSMAQKHEDAIGYWGQAWGQRYDVVAAINGDFFNGTTGVPTSGQIIGGWYAKRFTDFTGGSGFAWQLDRDVFIGECVRHVASKQRITYAATGVTQNINGINTSRGADELIIYTNHYNVTTNTTHDGSEVLVQMSRPMLILPPPAHAKGTVVDIRPNQGSALVPFDHLVLSGHGSAATKLLNNVSLGAEVQISQEITHYEHDCSTSLPYDWTKTYATIGGSFHFLKGGVVQTFTDPGATARHPRTAVAYDANYVYFIVVDGRSPFSVGMSMAELGSFCLTYLGATDGINQDGGGSLTMWVNGQVKNSPSDGSERPVANGLMMIVVQPTEQSARFVANESVWTVRNDWVRVGPGVNYTASGSVLSGESGTVLDHALGGVRASDRHWWKCQIGTDVGWVPDTALSNGDFAGDYDGDGEVTLNDLSTFMFCMQGPDVPHAPGNLCLIGDGDGDRDIDVKDFGVFQASFGG